MQGSFGTAVVVPAVVEKVDAALDGLVDDAGMASASIEVGLTEMVAAESDGGRRARRCNRGCGMIMPSALGVLSSGAHHGRDELPGCWPHSLLPMLFAENLCRSLLSSDFCRWMWV